MKKKTITIIMVLSLIVTMVLAGCANESTDVSSTDVKDPNKKAILVVSFGTSYADTREVTIEAVENKVADTFKDYEMRRAFTSDTIIKILKDRDGIEVDNPQVALEKLKSEGFSEVVVQPLHVICGEEFESLTEDVEKFKTDFDKLVIGRPILTTAEDYKIAAEALKTQLPELKEGEAVVLMGHGTSHPANAAYACFQYVLDDLGIENVFVGTVEGYPDLNNVIKLLKENDIDTVTLMPFMVVAGDHANNDMAGDEEDSWKTLLKKEGFIVNAYLHGLGENKAVQDIYIQHVKDTIESI
ncbi:MAG: sirohydrochlorin cobaltochelatase [Eubacteriales bacterium]